MRRTTGWISTFLICLILGLFLACSGHWALVPGAVTIGGVAAVLAIATWDGPLARRRGAGRRGGRGS